MDRTNKLITKNILIKPKILLLLFMATVIHQFAFAQYNDLGVLRIKIVPALGETVNPKKSDIDSNITTGIQSLDALNKKYSIVGMKRVFPYSPKFENRHKKHGLHLWYELEIAGSFTVDDIINDYGRIKEVTKAELKQAPQLINPQAPVAYSGITTKSASVDLPFNDPLLDKQWHYNNYGQSGGKPGADIRLFEAWKKATGSPNVIVSVHDMGVDVEHEDLRDGMWVNTAELNGETGVDDDENGYVDDINGYDFVSLSGSIEPGYHGTHVAGTVGATTNNGIGVSGIAGGSGNNDGVKIMSLRILGAPETNVAASFVYAADNGAVVSQNSWGYPQENTFSEAVKDGIDYFIEEAGNYPGSPMKGGVVIFAVGNLGLEGNFYPAAYDPVISVTALSSENLVTPYANYGDWVDISAPGGNGGDNAVLTGIDKTYANEVMSTLENNEYGFLDGTSMACPHVSGIAALIASKFQSSSFTNEELRTHLLTAFNDSIYEIEINKDYIGKLGVGAVDANLALATDNKIPPAKTTLLFNGEIAQDFIGVEWTVPVDNDDGTPFKYELIYSESEITTELLNEATILEFRNKNKTGDTLTYEVSGLKPTTTYHLAVRYIDRWGNTAPFSNIVTITTNEGPLVKNIGDTVSIAINIKTENSIKQDSFLLFNEGEGVLRWDLETRHIEGVPYSVKSSTSVYAPIKPEAYSKQRAVLQSPAKTKIQAYNIEDDNDEEYSDLESSSFLIVLGESDTELPNSSASRFIVPNPEGFNLTHVDTYIEIDDTSTVPTLEIFLGEDIATAKLLLSQKITNVERRFTRILLQEQLFFEENETFWIVVHVPPGNLYPLGAGIESTEEGSKNAFLSFDYGKSWSLLEELIPDNQMVWAVYAMSQYKKLDEYITLSPSNGQLKEGESVMIVATVDGENMVDGNYKGNVLLNVNEAERENIRVPVDINISGHDPIIQAPPRVDFGSVIMGYKRTQVFKLKNIGLSRLDVKNPYFAFDDAQFEYVQGINTEFDSGDEQEIYFSFAPEKPGLTVAYATLLDKNGDDHTFELFGVGLEPPVVEINPADTAFQNITISDTIQGKFAIKNEGKFTLDYFMPAFADGSNMESVPENFHRFGYRTRINPGDQYESPKYKWDDISSTGVDATQEIMESSVKVREIPHVQIDFGFSFPFFGTGEDSVLITSYGMLMFDLERYMWARTPLGYNFQGNADRFISAFGSATTLAIDKNAKIYYQKFSDKFIVQYNNANVSDPLDGTIFGKVSFQIVLHESGDIYFYYKEAEELFFPAGEFFPDLTIFDISTMIGIKDNILNDGVYIHDSEKRNFKFEPNSTIEFINPGLGLFTDLSKTYGSVRPGQVDTIEYKILTDSINIGTYKELLNIVTNDAENILIAHAATIQVENGAEPLLEISNDTLDFGDVFLGDSKVLPVKIVNVGRAPETITEIVLPNNYSKSGIELPYFIGPLKSTIIDFSIETHELGTYTSEIEIKTDADTVYTIFATGKIIPAPQISVDPGSISEVIMSGEQVSTTLKVSNPGDNELHFTMVGNEWLTAKGVKTQPESMDVELPEFDYQVSKSTEDGGPIYEWIEIAETGTGTKLEIDPYVTNFSNKIALPFTFNYYGVDYDSLIIVANGFVTFTGGQENADVEWSWGGVEIPNPNIPNNYIAPMWYGGGFEYKELFPYTGVYYQIEEDRIIVEYKDCKNGFSMGDPITFQVILYNTGNFKFQYKFIEGGIDVNMNYASVGIENQDGSDGIQISHNSHVVNENMSILFSPMETYKIPAGGEMDMHVNLDARKLYQSSYQYNMPVPNNAPNGLDLTVPVTFNVYGQASIEVPDSIDFGTKQIVDGNANIHIREFEIKNTGTAHFYIGKLKQALPDVFKTEAYLEEENAMTGESYWSWVNLFEFSSNTSSQTPIILFAGQTLKLRTTFAPEIAGTFEDGLVVSTTIRNHAPDTISFYAESLMPPVVGVDTTYIEAFAQSDNVVETRSFQLDNFDGGSNLEYTIEVEYIRNKANEATQYSTTNFFKSASVQPSLFAHRSTPRNYTKSAVNQLFNRVMSYENATEAEINLGFGGGYVFGAASRFTAPDDGYNLTHIQTWYAPGELLNSSFTINIYSGELSPSKLVHTQDYRHVIEEADADGKLISIELNSPVLFFPGESFFIEIHYDKEHLFPQGLSPIEAPIANTFFFGNEAQYFDMSESDFANYAWIIRAAELEFAGSTWVKLNSNAEGILAPGKDATVSFDILAEYADDGLNTALVHIKSNDPETPDKVVEVVLNHNNGPQFDLDGTELVVLELDTIVFEVEAYDIEQDEFTISYDNLPPFVHAEEIDKKIVITCLPDYESSGTYTLRFEGEDEHFNSNKMKVQLEVINRNRAPEAREMQTVVIGLDEGSHAIYGSDLFSDPDGDAVSLKYIIGDADVFETYVSGDDFLLAPLQVGESTIRFIASDAYGEIAENVVSVLVVPTNSDSGGHGWFEPYPNPTSDILNFSTQKITTIRTNYRVTNINGQTLMLGEISTTGDRKASINVAHLTSGIYFITLDNCQHDCTQKFIKR